MVTDNNGHLLEDRHILTDPQSIEAATVWLTSLAPIAIGIEGTSSYGSTITAVLLGAGHTIMEVTAANKVTRRQRGKSDLIDALQAAEAIRIGQRVSPVKDLSNLPDYALHTLSGLRRCVSRPRSETNSTPLPVLSRSREGQVDPRQGHRLAAVPGTVSRGHQMAAPP
ncbi:IS110 family transposase [Tessaracoccus sp. HDW20]|nr:IS110 family transposase [Tessaracoccus coleopterorum]